MAQGYPLWIALFLHTVYSCYGENVFDRVLDDVSRCSNTCDDAFSTVKNDQINLITACNRGCRLYSIIEFATDNDDTNATEIQCEESCKEAYSNFSVAGSCSLGCKSQRPYAVQRSKEEEELPQSIHVLYPIFMMHSMCNSMMDRLSNRLTASWTVYMQSDNGNLLVLQTAPDVSMDFGDPSVEEATNDEYKTSNYLETNIRSLDDSATPDLKLYSMDSSAQKLHDSQMSSDWLSCVSKKTGLPRLLLSLTIFVSAMMMIWLCLSSAATAPDHRVRPQKLSLYGDLEVIQAMKEKGLQHIHPQDGAVSYGPLPVKINVQKV